MKYYWNVNDESIPDNSELWCCAYQTDSRKENFALICLPCKCKVINGGCYRLNKKGDIIKSSAVSIYARNYADTYDECVEMYNELVQDRVNWLTNMLNNVKDDFI